jgi:CheY-like chemotaxis protein
MEALARTKEFVDRPVKTLLLVEDDDRHRASIEAVMDQEVRVTGVATAAAALAALERGRFDCAIVDLGLPDMPGADLIERMRAQPGGETLPIIVYTGKDLNDEEEARLGQIASTVIVKDAGSSERLLDETALFLHRAITGVPEAQQIRIGRGAHSAGGLEGKRVLIVDDDVRNIFSLTSALEQHGLEVMFAENGREGIELLKAHPDIDVMLVDIMMPEMDGYATMRAIRGYDAFRHLPLIAVTAKAMVGDREKCLDAGASDYVSKPVDVDHLLAVLRVQLQQNGVAGRPNGQARSETGREDIEHAR